MAAGHAVYLYEMLIRIRASSSLRDLVPITGTIFFTYSHCPFFIFYLKC